MDELQGRTIATKMKIPVVGTLGTLLKAKETGLTEFVRKDMEKLREIGFWINDKLFQKMLEMAKEG
jgi:predicted nucleic acid-binding protein